MKNEKIFLFQEVNEKFEDTDDQLFKTFRINLSH